MGTTRFKRPETFKPFEVRFVYPDGTEGAFSVTFAYKTTKEYGAWFESTFSDIPLKEDKTVDFEAMYAGRADMRAAKLAEVVRAWDLPDVPLDLAALQELSDEVPAGAIAMLHAYQAACTEGRLGN